MRGCLFRWAICAAVLVVAVDLREVGLLPSEDAAGIDQKGRGGGPPLGVTVSWIDQGEGQGEGSGDDGICRYEFLSPAMGDRVLADSELRVELFAVGCFGAAPRHVELLLDAARIAVLDAGDELPSVLLRGVGKGYHTLFARALCEQEDEDVVVVGKIGPECSVVNGTALFSGVDGEPSAPQRVVEAGAAVDGGLCKGKAVASPFWMRPDGRRIPSKVLDAAGGQLIAWALSSACGAEEKGGENDDAGALWMRAGRVQMAMGMFGEAASSYARAVLALSRRPVGQIWSPGATDRLTACIGLAQSLVMAASPSPPPGSAAGLEAAYARHLAALLPLDPPSAERKGLAAAAEQVVYGVVTGSGMLATRAAAVASTWMLAEGVRHAYLYSDRAANLSVCPLGSRGACSSRYAMQPTLHSSSRCSTCTQGTRRLRGTLHGSR